MSILYKKMASMARKFVEKDYYAKTAYHVYLRTLPGNMLFKDKKDLRFFRQCEFKIQERNPDIGIVSHSIMSTHLHLFLYQRSENAISTFMRQLIMKYRWFYGKKYKWSGPLFDSTFKGIHVKTFQYCQNLREYILANPDKDGRKDWQLGHESKLCAEELWLGVTRNELFSSLYIGEEDEGEILVHFS